MLPQAALAEFLTINALVGRVSLVDGGGGGGGGGGGAQGNGAKGGAVNDYTGVLLTPGNYTMTVAPTATGRPGVPGGADRTSTTNVASNLVKTSGAPLSLTGPGTASNTAPSGTAGDGAGGTASATAGDDVAGGPGVFLDITGAPIECGKGGASGNHTNPNNGTAGVNPGAGGKGGGGDDPGGAGGIGQSGAGWIRYPGPPQFTAGTVTTVGSDTLHTFPVGATNFTIT